MMKIISIDIGIFNLGMIVVELDNDYNIIDWELVTKVNIQDLCLMCRNPECNLPHEKTFSDYINHFITKYYTLFNEVCQVFLTFIFIKNVPIYRGHHFFMMTPLWIFFHPICMIMCCTISYIN